MLRPSFQLFHSIQKAKTLAGNDLFSYTADPRKIITIRLTVAEMKVYSSYVYLIQKTHTHPPELNADLKFRRILEDYPSLFTIDLATKQWNPSVVGQYFAQQSQKYTRLNSPIPMLEYKQYRLEIQ
jgi:hypothetical protein